MAEDIADNNGLASPISLTDWESAMQESGASAATTEAESNAENVLKQSGGSPMESLATVFSELGGSGQTGEGGGIDLVLDIPITVSVELGIAKVPVKNMMQLGQGSVIELDGRAGEPLTIYANGQMVAKGEVVLVNDRYGIRVTQLVNPARSKPGD